jgi:RNA polymerase sigma-70 factor (ECF subfamily)
MDDKVFAELIARVRRGDDEALEELLHSFEGEVRLMVRHRLPQALRSRFDSMDFVQSIWTSLFVNHDRERVDFDNPRHFRGFLAGVVVNKVNEEYRRQTRSKKYELAREERLFVRRGDREVPRAVAAPDPSPSQEAQAADRMAQLAAGRSPAEARALELRRSGLTFEEIAAQTGLHERTVRRLIGEIRDRLETRQWR